VRLTKHRYHTLIQGLCLFETEFVEPAEQDYPSEGRKLRRELESATEWLNAMRGRSLTD
jgi:hypothetical protein